MLQQDSARSGFRQWPLPTERARNRTDVRVLNQVKRRHQSPLQVKLDWDAVFVAMAASCMLGAAAAAQLLVHALGASGSHEARLHLTETNTGVSHMASTV